MWTAITREISPALADCQLSFVAREVIDVDRARAQHAAYRAALEALACEVLELPADAAYPDSVFVEDVALAFDEVAIATRPGAESRRDEGAAVLEVLGSMRPVLRIESPGTLDGGDVLRIGKRVFVGASARSNESGHQQLGELLAPYGYTVESVATRPGAESRRGEGHAVLEVLGSVRRILRIEAPGTLDGGDVLRIGKRLFVGASARSNESGHQQLRDLLAPHGYSVESVPMRDCLHLKSAVTQVGENAVLVNPAWFDVAAFAGYDCIEVNPTEQHAANALRVGDTLVYPDCFPRTLERLRTAGIKVVTVDVSELQKAEGAVTCCCILLRSGTPQARATP